MIKDVRAQADLIAALHLDGLFKMGYLNNAGNQRNSEKRYCFFAVARKRSS